MARHEAGGTEHSHHCNKWASFPGSPLHGDRSVVCVPVAMRVFFFCHQKCFCCHIPSSPCSGEPGSEATLINTARFSSSRCDSPPHAQATEKATPHYMYQKEVWSTSILSSQSLGSCRELRPLQFCNIWGWSTDDMEKGVYSGATTMPHKKFLRSSKIFIIC